MQSVTTTHVLTGDSMIHEDSQKLSSVLVLIEPQPPTLTIEEQPAHFYRFRYESEVEKDGGRVGGLLLGKNSSNGNKSFMKVRIGGINPALHSQLQLTVCTVSAEDKAPHPYYLHGDNCSDGFFLLKKSVDSTFNGDKWEVSFNRLAVICVPKKSKEDIDRGLEMRLKNVPPLPDYTEKSTVKYDSRNLGKIRLAFSFSYTDTLGQNWCLKTLFSEEIVAEKEKKSIDVDCLNPAEVPISGGSFVAVLTRTPTTGIAKSSVRIQLSPSHEESNIKMPNFYELVDMRKHLLVFRTLNLTPYTKNDRLKCTLTVHSNGFASEELDIVFSKNTGNVRAGNWNPRKRPIK